MPFEPESLEGMRAVIHSRSPSPIEAALPPGFGEVILRCFEKQPEHRFQTVAELAHALAPFCANPVMGWACAERTRRVLHSGPAMPMPIMRPARATAMEPPPERRPHGRSFRVIVLSTAATLGIAFGAFTASAELDATPPAVQPPPRSVESPPPPVEAAPVPPPAEVEPPREIEPREIEPREIEPPPPAAAPAPAATPTHTCEREKHRRSKRHSRAARERARQRAERAAAERADAEDLFASRR